MRRTLIEERLEIGLGENATSRRDRVELFVARCEVVKAGRIRLQQSRHLVDERTGPSRTGAIHALLGRGMQVCNLGVLTPQLDDDIDFGVQCLGCLRARDDLLDEGNVHRLGKGESARAGKRSGDGHVLEPVVDVRQ